MALIKKVKPCPLCGASDELLMIALPEEPGEMGIMCTWCENYISIKGDPDKTTLNDVIDRWNHQVGGTVIMPRYNPYYNLNLKHIRKLAFNKGWSMSHLCEKAGLSRTRATEWSKGRGVQALTVYKIANALDVEPENIIVSEKEATS